MSTDYHRFPQIFLISKDIVIITDFLFGTEIHGFIFNKDTAWLRIDISTALRDYGLLAQVHGLVTFFTLHFLAVSILCIALRLIKPFPSRSQAVSIRA